MKPFKTLCINLLTMTRVIIVEKSGDLKSLNIKNFDKNDLYKKCNFKKPENFECRTIWDTKNKFDFKFVEVWAKNSGKANTENKYDFPPPIDKDLFFGSCIITARNDEDNYMDITIEEWNQIYEKLFGGFEDLAATAEEDENEDDELEHVPSEFKTTSGYLKDSFIVDDNEIEDDENNLLEYDDDSELSFDEYSYSDEED